MAGFIRANYSLIRAERAAVSLLDGDDAGVKAVKDLNAYFSGVGEAFDANREYVVVRNGFAIEGLFPDSWIQDIHVEKPDWFREYIEDAGGALVSFAIKGSKDSVINRLKAQGEGTPFDDWSAHWKVICKALDGALAVQGAKVAGGGKAA